MSLPQTNDVQFLPNAGTFTVDSMTDSGGVPVNVLDSDVVHTVKGSFSLPSYLVGNGLVTVYADELGGPIDKAIGSTTVNVTGAVNPNDPPNKKYDWTVTIPALALPDPSPASGIYKLAVGFVFQSPPGGHTDIASFIDLGIFQAV